MEKVIIGRFQDGKGMFGFKSMCVLGAREKRTLTAV